MKKFLSILFVLSVFSAANLPGFAAITPEEATSETYIQNHGHSDEMSRLIDLQNAQINCEKTKYKGKDPDWYADKKVNFVRKVFMYFDCGLDDNQFMQHDIHYTNKYDDL
ncbi:MAG: hypothetical protein WCY19_02085 [Candidatus Gastranaerophilaceae bacterium]